MTTLDTRDIVERGIKVYKYLHTGSSLPCEMTHMI